MQYIQLQPQLAALVPTSGVGNLNAFLDTTDLIIKTKDDNGNIHGPVGFENLPLSGVTALIAASGLTIGSYYNISGVNPDLYGGTNIILQAATHDKLAKRGVGVFYNPKYDIYPIWSNTFRIFEYNYIEENFGLFEQNEQILTNNGQIGYLVGLPGETNVCFTTTSTQFSAATSFTGQNSNAVIHFNVNSVVAPSYSAGIKVIWGGKVWINLTGNIGNANDSFTLDSTNWLMV